MFALVSILLLTLITAVAIVWMYRLVLNWHHYTESQVDTPRTASWKKLATPQGFASFLSIPKEKVNTARLRNSRNDVKAPWGW